VLRAVVTVSNLNQLWRVSMTTLLGPTTLNNEGETTADVLNIRINQSPNRGHNSASQNRSPNAKPNTKSTLRIQTLSWPSWVSVRPSKRIR